MAPARRNVRHHFEVGGQAREVAREFSVSIALRATRAAATHSPVMTAIASSSRSLSVATFAHVRSRSLCDQY
jgi:hypothetical protein